MRAPELVFNKVSLGVDQDWGSSIDVWSQGCLVSCLSLPEYVFNDSAGIRDHSADFCRGFI